MHRIFTTTLLGLFALTAPLLHAEEFKYKIDPIFFEANPGGQPIGSCHGGAVIDKHGNIYLSTDTERGILAFTSKGKFIRAFGPSRIHGMELRKEKGEEYIYGARPSDHDVVKIKLDGTRVWTITAPLEAGTLKSTNNFKPCAVTADDDNNVYVADGYGSNYLYKFDKNQKFIKASGGAGDEEGKFRTCHGICLDRRGKKPVLLICNREVNRLEHWDLDLNYIETICKDLRRPSAVQIRGKYVAIAELSGRVTVLDNKAQVVAHVADNPNVKQRANHGVPPAEWTVGIANSPHGAALDKDYNIIINEWSPFGHLHKFDRVK